MLHFLIEINRSSVSIQGTVFYFIYKTSQLRCKIPLHILRIK